MDPRSSFRQSRFLAGMSVAAHLPCAYHVDDPMWKLLALCLSCLSAIAGPSNGSIRNVDFAKHTYPWQPTRAWPHDLEWQRLSESNHIELVKGRWKMPADSTPESSDFQSPFNGLTLEEVIYGDLTGDSTDEAVVVIRYDSGGTQYHHFVYIYGGDAERPRLLAFFRSGDRAANGLYRVSVRDRKLVVELFDPVQREGACCSIGFIRQQYRWNGSSFIKAGTIEHGPAERSSRRPVSVFGMPYDQMGR
jgi:hypothetical protein